MKRRDFSFLSKNEVVASIFSIFLLMVYISWLFECLLELFFFLPLLAGITSVLLSYTSLRYSWTVFMCALCAYYITIFYLGVSLNMVNSDVESLGIAIFGLSLILGLFGLARWFHKRPDKNTRFSAIFFFLLSICLTFHVKFHREQSGRVKCILQMVTIEKLVIGYRRVHQYCIS